MAIPSGCNGLRATSRGGVDDDNMDDFDDLFEPFELDEIPPMEPEPPARPQATTITCPSCGTHNPPTNRHCESCGARVSRAPLPVAPQPMLRTTPGARALGVLAAVILGVALLALIFNFLRDGGESEPTVPPDGNGATSSTTSTTRLAVQQLIPTRVEASSSLNGFPPEALIDEDPQNRWNDDSQRGVNAELRFFFAQPVQITQIVVQNVTDEAGFRRNYRIERLEVTIDDLPTANLVTLDNSSEPQTIDIASVATTEVTFSVRSTYPGETFEGNPPFQELALQEVKFFGRVSPSS